MTLRILGNSPLTVNIKRYDLREEEDASKFLDEVLRWEVGSQKYYLHLLNLDFSDVVEKMGEDKVNKMKNTLKQLVEWEGSHINIIEEIIKKENYDDLLAKG
jgi:cytidylate kinase